MVFRWHTCDVTSVCCYLLFRYYFLFRINVSFVLFREMYRQKQQQHISVAQKQLVKAKEKSAKYVPGSINLQIVGNGAKGAPASVYLFTDQSR